MAEASVPIPDLLAPCGGITRIRFKGSSDSLGPLSQWLPRFASG